MSLPRWLNNWWGKNLHRRLLVSNVAIILLFLLLLAYLAFSIGKTGLRREITQRNDQLATLVAKEIDFQFDNIWRNLHLFTHQLEESKTMLALQARAMLEMRRAAPLTYRALYLLDGEGQLLIHLAEPLADLPAIQRGEDLLNRPAVPLPEEILTAYQKAKNGELFISAPQLRGVDRVPVVYMGIPVTTDLEQPARIIVAEIDLRDMWRRVDEVRVEETGRAFLVSAQGVIIAHPNRAYIGRPLHPALHPVLDGYEGYTEYTDPISDRLMLASYSPIGGKTDWGIVVEQEQAEALASLNMLGPITLLVLAGAVAIVVLVTMLAAGSISQPIHQLVQVTQKITRTGDLSQDIDIVPANRRDVVGQLAVTFNQMISSLRQTEAALRDTLTESRQREAEISALLEGARAVLKHRKFEAAARLIFDAGKQLIGASAGYVALLNEDGSENEVLFLDAGGLPCTVDASLPMPIRGLRETAYRSQQAVYDNDFGHSEWLKFLPEGHVDLNTVLFAPLIIENKAVGLLGLANKPGGFTDHDARMATAFGELASIALLNSWNLDSLERSESHFRSVAQTAHDALITTDKQGKIIFWNQAAERMFGYPMEEIISQPLSLIIPETLNREQPEGIAGLLSGQNPESLDQTLEITGLTKERRSFPLELSLATWQIEEGTFYTIIGRDISQRQQAEAEIRRRNRELAMLNRIITGSGPEAILETTCYELGKAFDLVQVCATMFNEEKTSVSVVAEYHSEGQYCCQGLSYLSNNSQVTEQLLRQPKPLLIYETTNGPQPIPLQGGELQQAQNGTSFLIFPLVAEEEVVGSLNLHPSLGYPLSTEEINLVWSVATQVAGVLTRTRLAQARQRLLTAIEQTSESMVITDTQGTIIYVNPAFETISGYSRTEVIGRNPRMLKSGKHETGFYRDMWTTITAGEIWRGQLVNRRKNGSLYTLEATISPIRDEQGAIINYVNVSRDVTRELELEEQYHQAQKMESIGRLAGGVSHDFNNLLTGMLGYAGMALQALPPEDPIRHDIEGIQKNIERAANLTRQLLTFARRQVTEPGVINLNDSLLNIDKMLRRLIGSDIELVTLPAPKLGLIKADPGQIDQILLNLAINARDAMPNGGKLTIITTNVNLTEAEVNQYAEVTSGPYVMLGVSDTGVGMSEEIKSHIFEPFFTTKEIDKGTGLGLATVFGIVKQQGGHIWVESELNQGTTFKVYLPRIEESEQILSRRDTAPLLPRGTETILLAEDEISVRELAVRVLRGQGYTVLDAANGEEAVHLAQQYEQDIDLLLTDMVMPQMGGKILAERMQNMRPQTKILFMSGYADEAVVQHNLTGFKFAFMQKPFSPNTLAYKVRAVLDEQD